MHRRPHTDHCRILTKYVSIRSNIKKKQTKDQQCNKRGGFDHDGSFLAEKIENDDSNATFENAGVTVRPAPIMMILLSTRKVKEVSKSILIPKQLL